MSPEESFQSGNAEDPVETALAKALEGATAAGQWAIVASIAAELQARRLARADNVVSIGAKRDRR